MSDPRAKLAFEILVRENSRMLTAYLRSLVRDEAVVDDLFQETMLVAWRRLDECDLSRPFGPWVRGIASRLVLAHYRKRKQLPVFLDDARHDEALAQRKIVRLMSAIDEEDTRPVRRANRSRLAIFSSIAAIAAGLLVAIAFLQPTTCTRKRYIPNPFPDGFYTDSEQREPEIGLPENYYQFQWGDAQFIVLDPFRYTT